MDINSLVVNNNDGHETCDTKIMFNNKSTEEETIINQNCLDDNKESDSTKSEQNSDINNYYNASEKYIYTFDFPQINDVGYVTVYPNKIIVHFPDKANIPSDNGITPRTDVVMFINNQQKFSYQWLPIYSLTDFYKIQDMLIKCYTEFSIFTEWSFYDYTQIHKNYFKYYSDHITNYESNSFQIKCSENIYTTSLEITVNNPKTSLNVTNTTDLHFQIFIGKYLLFCSQRDLVGIPIYEMYFIINFILQKLIKE